MERSEFLDKLAKLTAEYKGEVVVFAKFFDDDTTYRIDDHGMVEVEQFQYSYVSHVRRRIQPNTQNTKNTLADQNIQYLQNDQ